MPLVKVSTKGQMIIPSQIRKAFHIKPETKLDVHVEGDKIVISPIPDDPIEACCGALQLDKSVRQVMKDVRREEKGLELKKFRRFQSHE